MKLIRDLPDSHTTQEVITICEDLQKEGHKVVIEHQGDRILLYDESMSDKPKIYLFVSGSYKNRKDVLGTGIAEDGTVLSGHFSSSIDFLKHDLGLTSTWKHDKYKAHYQEGYELVWLDDGNDLPKEVIEKNKVLYANKG